MNIKFLFDLDGCVTKCETLPLIANHFGLEKELEILTEKTTSGNIPFIESFIKRVFMLKDINVKEIAQLLETVELFPIVSNFIYENKDNCAIVSGNLDCYINKLIANRLWNVDVFCSHAVLRDDKVEKINDIIKKDVIVNYFKEKKYKTIFVGDGNNDAAAMRLADVKIACGLVHQPANSVLEVCDYVVYDEETLCNLLRLL